MLAKVSGFTALLPAVSHIKAYSIDMCILKLASCFEAGVVEHPRVIELPLCS